MGGLVDLGPGAGFTLDEYEAEHDVRLARPVPLADYLRYGRWYQRHAVPGVDQPPRHARRAGAAKGFCVHLADGEQLRTRRVVIATGPSGFVRRPPQFARLEPPLVRHGSELRELDEFAGLRTAVIGSGQSAIELAALIGEAGGDVEVIARADRIRWLRRSGWLHARDGALRRMLYPPTDVGPVGLSWLVAKPNAFRRVPTRLGERIAYRCIRPAASSWLVPRTASARLTLGRVVASAAAVRANSAVRIDARRRNCARGRPGRAGHRLRGPRGPASAARRPS